MNKIRKYLKSACRASVSQSGLSKFGLSKFGLSLSLSVSVPALAYANSANWVQPATGILETLESGLVQVGSFALGIGVVAYGIVQVISGQPNWTKIGFMLVGGILIMSGPTILRTLLGA